VKSVAELIHPVTKKNKFPFRHDPIVIELSQYFAVGRHIHVNVNAASRQYTMETSIMAYTIIRKVLKGERRR